MSPDEDTNLWDGLWNWDWVGGLPLMAPQIGRVGELAAGSRDNIQRGATVLESSIA